MTSDPGGLKVVHTDDPQSWNMYVYGRNSPTTLTDATGLDFWLMGGDGCTSGAVDCDNAGHVLGPDGNPIIISSNNQDDLEDQYGNRYTGTFNGQTVTFTDANGAQSEGSWIQGSNPTSGITGSGPLDNRFQFTFENPGPGQTLHADFTFSGTVRQAEGALEAAHFEYHFSGGNSGFDEYRSQGSFWTGADSDHFNVKKSPGLDPTGEPSVRGNMHVGEYNPFRPFGWAFHCIKDRACF